MVCTVFMSSPCTGKPFLVWQIHRTRYICANSVSLPSDGRMKPQSWAINRKTKITVSDIPVNNSYPSNKSMSVLCAFLELSANFPNSNAMPAARITGFCCFHLCLCSILVQFLFYETQAFVFGDLIFHPSLTMP